MTSVNLPNNLFSTLSVVNTAAPIISSERYITAAAAGGSFFGRHARGTVDAPLNIAAADSVLFMFGQGWVASAWRTVGNINMSAQTVDNSNPTFLTGRVTINLADAAGANQDVLIVDAAIGLYVNGSQIVRTDGVHHNKSLSNAAVVALAAPTAGDTAANSGSRGLSVYDGTRWNSVIQEHPGYIAGRWYRPVDANVATSGAITTGTVRMSIFYLPAAITVDALAVRIVANVAVGNVKVAIYANDPATCRPTGAALVASGDITTATATIVSSGTLTSAVLPAGFYWFAIQADATAGTGGVTVSSYGLLDMPGPAYMGSATLANILESATASRLMLTVTQAYGSFPDMTAASFTEVTSTTCALPMFRAA
jgi:hypothetical protein